MINTNLWNKIRYTLYSPIYSLVIRIFYPYRKKTIEQISFSSGDKVLIVGCGAGNDLEFIPSDVESFCIDITPRMIQLTRNRAERLHKKCNAEVMDAMNMNFPDQYFDHVVCNLILAVVPDPYKCISEVNRVLRPKGLVVVFDKFLDEGQSPSFLRRILNYFMSFIATDINRCMESLAKSVDLKRVHREKVFLSGNFKIFKYIRPE